MGRLVASAFQAVQAGLQAEDEERLRMVEAEEEARQQRAREALARLDSERVIVLERQFAEEGPGRRPLWQRKHGQEFRRRRVRGVLEQRRGPGRRPCWMVR